MTAEKINVAECKKTVKSIVTKVLVFGIGNIFCQSSLLLGVLVLAIFFTSIANIPVPTFQTEGQDMRISCTKFNQFFLVHRYVQCESKK